MEELGKGTRDVLPRVKQPSVTCELSSRISMAAVWGGTRLMPGTPDGRSRTRWNDKELDSSSVSERTF